MLQEREILFNAAKLILNPRAFDVTAAATIDGLYAALDDIDDRKIRNAAGEERRQARAAFAKALRNGLGALSQAERRHVQNVAVSPTSGGGFMVPAPVFPELAQRLKFYSAVASVARIIETAHGAPLTVATVDDTANPATLLAEAATASNLDLTFGTVVLGAYKFTSGIAPASFEIVQDSALDVAGMIVDLFAKRLGRGQNAFFTTGTGTVQPQGVVTGASLGVTLPIGNTTTITHNGIVQLYQALDPAYRAAPNCAFMTNDNTLQSIKQLVDSTNQRPLWLPDVLPPPPGSAFHGQLMGKPIVINNDMANMAANAKPLLFGDFANYAIRQVRELEIIPMPDSAYGSKGQLAFVAFSRADGRVLISQAIKYLQNSAT